jgi:hypothetical protein
MLWRILISKCVLFVLALPWSSAVVLEENNFQIIYDEQDATLAKQSLATLLDARDEFEDRLSPGAKPIRVVIAHTLDEFLSLGRGLASKNVTGFARPQDALIVVKSPRLGTVQQDYRGTLRHELVHVLLYRNVNTDRLPKWLNEGLSMSLANEYRWASPWQVTKMFLGNRIIPYRHLDMAFIAPGTEQEFGDAYGQALSMTRHLRDELGEERFWLVIKGTKDMTFPDALNQFGLMSPLQFWMGYERSLWTVVALGMVTSTSLFTPAAFLLIIAWFRKRHSNRKILERWALEESGGEGTPFSWDDVVEDSEAWKDR